MFSPGAILTDCFIKNAFYLCLHIFMIFTGKKNVFTTSKDLLNLYP